MNASFRHTATALAFAAFCSASLGCGDNSSDAAAPPDGGPSDAMPDGAPTDGMSNEVPFADAFIAHPLTCESHGNARFVAPLPAGRFQFGDCTFDLETLPAVHGDVTARVVGTPPQPDNGPWTIAID